MKCRWVYLLLVLVSLGLWFLLCKAFAWLIVWFVEGNWYLLIDRYEAAWEGIRMTVLLIVGAMIVMFFLFSLTMGIKRSQERWRR